MSGSQAPPTVEVPVVRSSPTVSQTAIAPLMVTTADERPSEILTSRSEPEQFQASSGGQGNRLFPPAQTPEQDAQALSLTEQAPKSATNSELLSQAKLILAMGVTSITLGEFFGHGPFDAEGLLYGTVIIGLSLWYLYRSVQKGFVKSVLVIAILYAILLVGAISQDGGLFSKDDNFADTLSTLLFLPMPFLMFRIFWKMRNRQP
jgi:hypothetical protein